MLQRRQILIGAGVGLSGVPAWAQKSDALPDLRIVIPANPGGGWDQTGRAFGAALQSAKLVDRVQYENIGGKAGTVGMAQFVERYASTPNTLMMGGLVLLGGVALHRPSVEISQIKPVAGLTSDFMVVAVPANSPLRSLKDLADALGRPEYKATVVGGSAGGVDHMLLGMMLRARRGNPDNYSYLATSSGNDAVRALTEGKAQIGISGYSEFRNAMAAGSIRALAVSSRRARYGLPSLREGGIDTDLANWRGFFAPAGISEAQTQVLATVLERGARSAEWAELLQRNDWVGAYRGGSDFRSFVESEMTTARVVVHMLKLKA